MTLDEAIAEQEEFLEDNPHVRDYPWGKGMKLGIEALKRVKAGRPAPPSLAYLPLLGETDKLGRR